ncbi:MAG: hypothetical protein AB1Z98_17205 [Nannocystaceae bacterium]
MVHALVIAGLLGSAPAADPGAEAPNDPVASPAVVAGPQPPRRARKPPWSWRFVGAHYGTGVMASLLVLPGSYALAGWVGHRGKGLGPVIGGLLIGAFVPPVLSYTTQWAVGRAVAGKRERYWPGFLVQQVGHLGVFAGAILGGASFYEFRDVAPVVLVDAVVVTGLGSLTAEATRRPLSASSPPEGELSWQRHQRLWGRPRVEVIVPIVRIALP